MSLAKAHLRVARPTDNLTEVMKFYRDGLGFEVLYEFRNHDGFDGVMLGHKGAAYHLEFTHKRGTPSGGLRVRITFWCFTSLMNLSGNEPCCGYRTTGTSLLSPSIRIGTSRARRSKTQTDIE